MELALAPRNRTIPKQGRWHVALLVGGPADIGREIRDRLAESKAIEIRYHWDYEHRRNYQGPLPKDVDFVILLKDMIGHSDQAAVKRAVGRQVPIIRTQRKWAAMAGALYTHGFTKDELPLGARSVMVLKEIEEPVALLPVPVPAPEPEPAIKVKATAPKTYALCAYLQSLMLEEGVDSVLITGRSAEVQLRAPS